MDAPAVETLAVVAPAVETLAVVAPAVETPAVDAPAVETLVVVAPVETLTVASCISLGALQMPSVLLHLAYLPAQKLLMGESW